MSRILVELPKDRTRLGVLRFFDDTIEMRGAWPCLSKLATGTYRSINRRDMGCTSGVMHDYGATEAIAMEASSGNALTAKVNGRPISLIHGGALSPEGTLRPSQGVRLSEVNMLSLDLAMATFGEPAQVIIGEGLK